jgi:cytochrome c oxidase subunit III
MASTTKVPPQRQIAPDLTSDEQRIVGSELHGRIRTSADVAQNALPAETGIWVAIAAISMTFASLISALIVRQGVALDWLHFQLPRILYLNTAILLASSVTLEISRRGFDLRPDFSREGSLDHEAAAGAFSWLCATMALGLFFVLGQVMAWRELAAKGLFLSSSPSSSFFYVLTALHGLHLLGGIVGLVYVLYRLRPSTGLKKRGVLGVASVYWHFMDGLWVFLLVVLAART